MPVPGRSDKTFSQMMREYFVFYGIIPAFVISVLLLGFVIFFQQYMLRHEVRQFNRQSTKRLEEELAGQEVFLADFSASGEIGSYLSGSDNVSILYEDFYQFHRNTDLKCVLMILDRDGEVVSSSIKISDEHVRIRVRMIAERIKREPSGVLREANQLDYPAGIQSVYTIGTVVQGGDEIIGYVLLQSLAEGMEQVLRPGGMLRQVAVDRFDRIISIQNELDYQPGERFYPDENQQYYSYRSDLEAFGITVYTSGAKHLFRRSYWMIVLFLVLLLIHLIILVSRISRKVSRRVTEPINELVAAFGYLKEGQTGYLTESSEIEEFRFLSAEYNHTVTQLNQLIKRNTELQELRRIAEIKQLEAQFDPHFFLNMLESLRYMSLMSREEAEKMILSLSGILRYSLYNKNQYATIADDIKYVEDYLFLQKVRIGSNFSYRIELEPGVGAVEIPKLLIQPLIENSVKHGYQGVSSFCVSVSIGRDGSDLVFQVCDNGKGISEEDTRRLLHMIEQEDSREHIGLLNVHKRLNYMFGTGYGIREIDGSRGFRITIRMKGGEEQDE